MIFSLQVALQYSCTSAADPSEQKCPLAMQCIAQQEQYLITRSNCMRIMF